MLVLSHRGYWKEGSERNQLVAFKRSFDLGFGIETDLRDCLGGVVIAHDMPTGKEMSFEQLLQLMGGRNLPLALNIKADGLSSSIKNLLDKYSHTNYFTFDMSIPDMISHINDDLKVFTGLSDILPHPVLLEKCSGVWLDSFNDDWPLASTIDSLIVKGKSVCIVSAELHGRSKDKQWEMLKHYKGSKETKNVMLCTDFPEIAREYFNGTN